MLKAETLNSYTFQVHGVHCIKCIRTIQSVADKFKSIKYIDVDLGAQSICTKVSANFPVEDFLTEIRTCGFGISSPKKFIDESGVKGKTQQSLNSLKRIGVAGACAGNIMILSAAEYAGAQIDEWPGVFKFFSLLFFIPVFSYSGWPLYQNAWQSLKSKKLSIDAPIVLAIIGGSILSFYNYLSFSNAQVYFDSIAMFIFFLISSRYVVLKIQAKYTKSITTEDIFSLSHALLVKDGENQSVDVQDIKLGDVVYVPKDSYVGFDGQVEKGVAYVSDAFYSGEVFPKRKLAFDQVFAGSKNAGEGFCLRVNKLQDQTRLSEIIRMLNSSIKSKTYLSDLADKGASILTVMIFIASAIVLIYFSFFNNNLEEGVNRVLALLVVACPCGLAIATPLVQTVAVKKALRNSLLVKDVSVFESFLKLDSVFFDKTGTLTKGEIQVVEIRPRAPLEVEKQIIYNLELISEHPIAKALKSYIGKQDVLKIKNYREEIGKGVFADYDNKNYSLTASKDQSNTLVFKIDSKPTLFITIDDRVSKSAREVVSFFKSESISPYILSGDSKEETLKVAQNVGIDLENAYYQKNPFEKSEIIKNHNGKILYFGDGINDSLAMSQSLISVSMQSSADVAFKSSKIHIIEGGLSRIFSLVSIAKRSFWSMKVIISVSLLYNIIFAILASSGFIKPLIAVVIMPISSISITFLGLFLMKQPYFKKQAR